MGTEGMMSQATSLWNNKNHILKVKECAIAGCLRLDRKQSCETKLNLCNNTTKATKSLQMSGVPSTGTEKVFCPFYDEHVKEISDKLWLPSLIGCAEPLFHWSVGCYRNTASNSWFTIQKWTPQKQSSQTSSWPLSPSSSAGYMAGVHIRIAPTEAELTEEMLAKKKEGAAKRAEEKKRKAEERKLTRAPKRQKTKSAKQLEREAAAAQKRQAKLEERERRKEAAEKRRAENKQKQPTVEQLAARKKAVEKKEAKKANAANACRTVRLYPGPEMKTVLKKWMGCYRVLYNRALALSKSTKAPKSYNYHGFVRAAVCNEESIVEPWLKQMPAACRKLAAKDLCEAFWSNHAKRVKNGGNYEFRLRFKSKKDASQVLKVESAHLRFSRGESECLRICPDKAKVMIKDVCIKRGVNFEDGMLDIPVSIGQLDGISLVKDVVITMDRLGRFWMHCPYRREVLVENQDRPAQWTALDPGNRVFLTSYDPSGESLKFGADASNRITRLCQHLDSLISKTDLLSTKVNNRWHWSKKKRVQQKIARMKKAQQRLRYRIRNLVAEMHWKCASYLCQRYTDIILPEFATQQMVCKTDGRCIRNKTARCMMTMSHFMFRQRLLHSAKMCGARVYIRQEDYTSKTCTNCGEIHDRLGSNKVFSCPSCGLKACRDGAGARNIFLKNAVVEFH